MERYEICFSPTGGTKKATKMLTEVLTGDFKTVDLTDSTVVFQNIALKKDDLAVISVPSYNGRVPHLAAGRLGKIQGNGAKAILLCSYGNRAYEDTLVELRDIANQAGFRIVAAIAAVAEHSIAHQFATGRPDKEDQAQLHTFAEVIQSKLDTGDDSEPVIPGNRPYKKDGGVTMVPKPTKNCTTCGLCAQECPAQAIDASDPKKVDKKKCISCMRCVSVCPHSARSINAVMLSVVGMALKKACANRKDNELYK